MRVIARTLASVVAATLVCAAPVVAQHFPTDSELLELIRNRVEEGRATGIVVGVLEADGTRRIQAYGDPGPGARPLGPRSVFEIGSITKVFTGILLADMAADGLVAIEGAVQEHLPDGVTMPSRPGHSNLAVGLMGHVLGLRSGAEYEDLVRERILSPLAMEMTGIALSPDMEAWMAKGHNRSGRVVPLWDLPTLAGAGALRSNAEDMLGFHLINPELDLAPAPAEERTEVSADREILAEDPPTPAGSELLDGHLGVIPGQRHPPPDERQ